VPAATKPPAANLVEAERTRWYDKQRGRLRRGGKSRSTSMTARGLFKMLLVIVASPGVGLTNDAAAELLSSRPIPVVIPFTPGGSSDTLQRIVNKKVSDLTGQTLIVESRPGGGGAIGAVAVKQAPPDGHTLFQASAGTHASNIWLYPTLPYDPVKDFRPLTLTWSLPHLLPVPHPTPPQPL